MYPSMCNEYVKMNSLKEEGFRKGGGEKEEEEEAFFFFEPVKHSLYLSLYPVEEKLELNERLWLRASISYTHHVCLSVCPHTFNTISWSREKSFQFWGKPHLIKRTRRLCYRSFLVVVGSAVAGWMFLARADWQTTRGKLGWCLKYCLHGGS